MIIDIVVPSLGESITEVELGSWTLKVGDYIAVDEPVVDVESEKATLEVPAPKSGVIVEILVAEGEVASVGDVIARLDTEGKPAAAVPDDAAQTPPAPEALPAAPAAPAPETGSMAPTREVPTLAEEKKVMPAARRVLGEAGVDGSKVTASGPGNRVLKEDAQAAAAKGSAPAPNIASMSPTREVPTLGGEQRKRMSPLRRTIARRLVQAKQEMAILTTFNEVDMSAVKQMRAMVGEAFLQKNGVKLGFMSFFVRAAQYALKQYPLVNAMIDGNDVVYHDQVNVGVAIGGGKGLVVPILRNVEAMSMAQIETQILDYAGRAQNGTLAPEELEGGTFTISNGGVYGSMLSTPIVNPPQSAILGLHSIKDRVVVENGEMVIRPIMYLALSYDHRLIDGRVAVGFLKTILESIEKPAGMILEV